MSDNQGQNTGANSNSSGQPVFHGTQAEGDASELIVGGTFHADVHVNGQKVSFGNQQQ
ncbi:hypothetical protein OG897_39945 [Streptomyces sp. NBC_00237]|uniref:hypothetical protein n=1 Tax=Streptomyces sp. NBC_00237 TaxID=2975687 RepID=UPI002250D14B|nr:hypothetical protein [Streptomyces sp. NBC_00237]MCX5207565.1 hypothetical protein [Streptomyces sp. NBC_00237]